MDNQFKKFEEFPHFVADWSTSLETLPWKRKPRYLICRETINSILKYIERQNLLLVGGEGTGKSTTLLELIYVLTEKNIPVYPVSTRILIPEMIFKKIPESEILNTVYTNIKNSAENVINIIDGGDYFFRDYKSIGLLEFYKDIVDKGKRSMEKPVREGKIWEENCDSFLQILKIRSHRFITTEHSDWLTTWRIPSLYNKWTSIIKNFKIIELDGNLTPEESILFLRYEKNLKMNEKDIKMMKKISSHQLKKIKKVNTLTDLQNYFLTNCS